MRKILLVIDMQNDFIDGVLGTLEAEAIIDKVVQVIYKYPLEDIIATRDAHSSNYLENQEGQKLPVPHCIQGTAGWRIVPAVHSALAERAGRSLSVLYLTKSTFGSRDLAELLAQRHREQPIARIELVGLCTDICVVSNALLLRAKLPGTVIKVDASCCAGVTKESHNAALATMKMCQIDVI